MSRKRLTTEEFITRARELHGHKYDYSLVEYVNWCTPVKVTCPEHGVFEQIPNNHVSLKHGCPWCAVEQKRSPVEEFITRARELHGHKYDYSLVEHKGAHTKVKITCPEHGVFEQTPNNHVHGRGCPQCAREQSSEQQRLTTEEFVNRAREIHGNKYDYSLVEYINNFTRVKIICPEHGVFEQTPNNHCCLNACPQCSQAGFNPLEPGTLYVLTDDKQCPTLLKVGVTNDLKQRLRQLQRRTPHPVVKLVSYPFPHGADAYKLEQEVHKVFRELNARLKGFDGATEWFKYSPAILDYINEKARN